MLQANAEVENALIGFLKAQQAVKYLATSAEAATQSLDLVRLQYKEGQTDFNRVLNVEQLLDAAGGPIGGGAGAVAQNLILVYRAIGGGWQIRCAPVPPPPAAAPQQPAPPPAEVVPLPPATPTTRLPQPPAMPTP